MQGILASESSTDAVVENSNDTPRQVPMSNTQPDNELPSSPESITSTHSTRSGIAASPIQVVEEMLAKHDGAPVVAFSCSAIQEMLAETNDDDYITPFYSKGIQSYHTISESTNYLV